MASRPFLKQFPVIGIVNGVDSGVSGDMSATSITSKVTILQMITVGTYSYIWSGTSPIGNLAVQVSNDYKISESGEVLNSGTWTTIYVTLNGSTVVNAVPLSGNSGSGVIEWTTGAYAIRTVYTKVSGTGTLQCVINGKVT